MSWHWKELLPIDRYTVRAGDHIHSLDEKVLSLLYQPLVGSFAYSLYMTLWNHLERDVYWSDEYSHRHLMSMMDAPLNIIYQERKKLEGIGLLKTYKKKEEESTSYLYELQPPMSPSAFFSNDVLSVYLYNRLGKNNYLQIRERFMVDTINEEEYVEITYAFDEVFTSLHHSEIVSNHQSELQHILEPDQHKSLLQRNEKEDLLFNEYPFDFELFETSLSDFIASKDILTKEVRETILRLSFVYRIEPLEMSNLVQQTILHDDEINLAELRKKVQQWYKFVEGNEPPVLSLRQVQPKQYQTMLGKTPTTDEERYIQKYETQSPLFILQERAGGVVVPPADMKIAESLIIDYKLHPGVANVLLDSVMLQNDMKLSKSLVEKIAGHWARKGVQTVKEAMALAKQEYKTIQDYKDNGQKEKKSGYTSTKRRNTQSNVRKEKLPQWLIEEKEGKTAVPEPTNNEEFIEKKKKFEEMIKMHQIKKTREE